MKKSHFMLGSNNPKQLQISSCMSDPLMLINDDFKRHIKVAKESKKTHFKLSVEERTNPGTAQSSLTTTQRQAYRNTSDIEIIQPTINANEFKRTHFNFGFHKSNFETTNDINESSKIVI